MTADTIAEPTTSAWNTEKLNDRAYNELKNKIISRELAPGTRLVDSQLAEKYGISRTPVRDAIRKLVEEGLVVSSNRKGFFVFKPNAQDIVEVFEVRLILDRAVVTKIITEILPGNYSHYMDKIHRIAEHEEEGRKKGRTRFMQYDEEFHDSLIRFSNNSRLINIYGENQNQLKGFRFQTSINQERFEEAVAMHSELIAALKNMDLEAALRSVNQHVEISRKAALGDFAQNGDAPGK